MANLARLPMPIIEQWEWQFRGSCRQTDPEVFFPPDSERGARRRAREAVAKSFCAQCPVLEQCRAHALAVREPYGVWGGLNPAERELLISSIAPHTPSVTRAGEVPHPQKRRSMTALARRVVRR
jgi:WhiB family transcriptional regulator, redox-sensing transcriptional regulator